MSKQGNLDIAIIGISGRFPGADTVNEYWSNLNNGLDSIVSIPNDRWGQTEYYRGEKGEKYKIYCPTGGFLDNIHGFDKEYFGIDAVESKYLEAQQKLVLQLTKKLFDNAGISKDDYYGSDTSVYMAASTGANAEMHSIFGSFAQVDEDVREKLISKFGVRPWDVNCMADSLNNMTSGRISHEFNLKGASSVIDTACSSSLVALHEACHALLRYESSMAICGGVNLYGMPTGYYGFSAAGALSESGKVYAFDERADGFVPGEGAGLILLKNLSQAIEDGNHIYAVIKGSVINNDGHTIGVMAPNPNGQKKVINKFYKESEVKPNQIQYLEAHGTGTKIGDLSEINSLTKAFSDWDLEKGSISIGSVKANIGHTLTASGVASIIKIVGMMHDGSIYPQINCERPNKKSHFNENAFCINNSGKAIKKDIEFAAINSFGFGGTNAHLILENGKKYNKRQASTTDLSKYAVIIGGHTEKALQARKKDLLDYIQKGGAGFGDFVLANNYLNGEYSFIDSGVISSFEDLKSLLKGSNSEKREKKSSIMLFTGQGSQYSGMGRSLYETIPKFRANMELCNKLFKSCANLDVIDLLYVNSEDGLLAKTEITQPVIFSIEYSLGKLLLDSGFYPNFMIGHSIGEWVAATLSKVLSLENAVDIVSFRSKLMSELNNVGSMTAVFSPLTSEIEEILTENQVYLSADNISHIVLAGKAENMDNAERALSAKGLFFKKLSVSSAFHTPLFDDISIEFKNYLDKFTFNKPKYQIIGNVTGEVIKEYSSDYWSEHLTKTVKFKQSVELAVNSGASDLVECGSSATLIGMISSVHKLNGIYFMSPKDNDQLETFSKGLLDMCLISKKFSLAKVYDCISYNKLILPEYPFQESFESIIKSHGRSDIHKWAWVPVRDKELSINNNDIIVKAADFEDAYDLCNYVKVSITHCHKEMCDIVYEVPDVEVSVSNYDDCESVLISRAFEFLKCVREVKDKKINLIVHLKSYDHKLSKAFAYSAATFILALSSQITSVLSSSVIINDDDKVSSYLANEWLEISDDLALTRKLIKSEDAQYRDDIDKNEVVLITGGTGSIGLRVCKSLIDSGYKNIVLSGRHMLDDSIREKLASIDSERVHYSHCDVTDVSGFEKSIREIESEYGVIGQVFHFAGKLDRDILCSLSTDFDKISEVFRSKVLGTLVIDKLLSGGNIKRLLLLSSISASDIKWSRGISDYAAANSFLDFYAESSEINTLALNYTLWDGNGIGSAVCDYLGDILLNSGLETISETVAIDDMFLLNNNLDNRGVYHIFNEVPVRTKPEIDVAIETKSEFKSTSLNIDLSKEEFYKLISKYTSEDVTENNEDDNFLSLGLDSITAMSLIEEARSGMGINIYPTVIFEYQTPNELFAYIESEFQQTSKKSIEAEKDARSGLNDDIAIVGIAVKASGAENLNDYWENRLSKKVSIGEIPKKHFVSSGNEKYSGGYIESTYEFDSLFFGISPSEAKYLDPQQRKLLEITYDALQQAGYINSDINEIGVYVGGEQNYYGEQFSNKRLMDRLEKVLDSEDAKKVKQALMVSQTNPDAITGNSINQLATRINYTFGFTGPSMAINTACSSSLVALSIACSDLMNKNIDAAVVGGVNLNLSDMPFVSMELLGAISPKGECRPFDDSADGMMLGEAVISIVIKRLSDAVEDKNYIYGTIKGIATNNNGHSQGVTVPSVKGQQSVMERAAGSNVQNLKYIAAHGTGTALGDPIEMSSIVNAYKGKIKNLCYISSNKGNVGHSLSASGLLSVVEVLKVFDTNKIPPVAGLAMKSSNMNIPDESNLKLAESVINIEEKGTYLAGVNAFGFGGTNASVLLEKYNNNAESEIIFPQIVLLSSYSPDSLARYAYMLRDVLNEVNVLAVIKQVNCHSKVFDYKAAFIALNVDDLKSKLSDIGSKSANPNVYVEKSKRKKDSAEFSRELFVNTPYNEMEKIAEFCHVKLDNNTQNSLKNKLSYIAPNCRFVNTNSEESNSIQEFLDIIAKLYIKGYEINLKGIYNKVVYPVSGIAGFNSMEYKFHNIKQTQSLIEVDYDNIISTQGEHV